MKYRMAINGEFLSKPLTGTQRYAYEILKKLDELCEPHEFVLIVPKWVKVIPSYKNIDVYALPSNIRNSFLWIQISLYRFLKKNHLTCIHLCNFIPILRPDYVCIHDICYRVNPWLHPSRKDKLSRLIMHMIYSSTSKKAKKIFTVSEFTKGQLMEYYHTQKDKIVLVQPGWQHMLDITEDTEILNRYSFLQDKSFYFTLGSLSKRKNMKWIIEMAKKNPEVPFAVSGYRLQSVKEDGDYSNLPNNIHLLGYLTDGQIKALYKSCKAFLFPSFYEGFGLPPLEALSMGATVVVSTSGSLPEIYKDSAHYINSYDYSVDLTSLLEEKVTDSQEVLNQYSWEKAALRLYHEINKTGEKQ